MAGMEDLFAEMRKEANGQFSGIVKCVNIMLARPGFENVRNMDMFDVIKRPATVSLYVHRGAGVLVEDNSRTHRRGDNLSRKEPHPFKTTEIKIYDLKDKREITIVDEPLQQGDPRTTSFRSDSFEVDGGYTFAVRDLPDPTVSHLRKEYGL